MQINQVMTSYTQPDFVQNNMMKRDNLSQFVSEMFDTLQ